MNPGKALHNDLKLVPHFSVNHSKNGRLVTKFQALNLMSVPPSFSLQLLILIKQNVVILARQGSVC